MRRVLPVCDVSLLHPAIHRQAARGTDDDRSPQGIGARGPHGFKRRRRLAAMLAGRGWVFGGGVAEPDRLVAQSGGRPDRRGPAAAAERRRAVSERSSSVPDRPTWATTPPRAVSIADALVADRANAQYDATIAPLTPAAAPQPPSPAPTGDNTSSGTFAAASAPPPPPVPPRAAPRAPVQATALPCRRPLPQARQPRPPRWSPPPLPEMPPAAAGAGGTCPAWRRSPRRRRPRPRRRRSSRAAPAPVAGAPDCRCRSSPGSGGAAHQRLCAAEGAGAAARERPASP